MMRLLISVFMAMTFLGGAGAAISAERTVTLDVAITCSSCSYIVGSSLKSVNGVLSVSESYYGSGQFTVRFDDEKTNVQALTGACGSVGFAANLVN